MSCWADVTVVRSAFQPEMMAERDASSLKSSGVSGTDGEHRHRTATHSALAIYAKPKSIFFRAGSSFTTRKLWTCPGQILSNLDQTFSGTALPARLQHGTQR